MVTSRETALIVERYAIYDEIAAGGMASVHIGRLLGKAGFTRTVAIKRLQSRFADDPDFVSMFIDEARLAARIQHANVVQTLDVVATQGELFVVMEYVRGESFSRLLARASRRGKTLPLRVVATVVSAALHGLHAAHEAKNDRGEPLNIVHRDVSPHNILVGTDGVSRVLDFGVAKATQRLAVTSQGQLKGKVAYMSPEQIRGKATRATDVYAAAVVLWEAVVGRRLFPGESEPEVMGAVLKGKSPRLSEVVADIPPALDELVARGLATDPEARFATAREMAFAIEKCVPILSPGKLGEWLEATARERLARKALIVAEIEANEIDVRPAPRELDSQAKVVSDASPLEGGSSSSVSARIPSGTSGVGVTGSEVAASPMTASVASPWPPRRGAPRAAIAAAIGVAVIAIAFVAWRLGRVSDRSAANAAGTTPVPTCASTSAASASAGVAP